MTEEESAHPINPPDLNSTDKTESQDPVEDNENVRKIDKQFVYFKINLKLLPLAETKGEEDPLE